MQSKSVFNNMKAERIYNLELIL